MGKQITAGAICALAFFASPGLAQELVEWDEDASAVYLARVTAMDFIAPVPCPPESICMDSEFSMTVEPLEPLGGTADVGVQTFRVLQHGPYRPSTVLVIATQRDTKGNWHLIDRTSLYRETCFNDPDGMIWDNVSDPKSEWVATYDRATSQTCLRKYPN